MRIVVVGGGETGYEVARVLAAEKQDVAVVETDPRTLRRIQSELDVLAVHGSGASPKTLELAGVKEAGLLIAVTRLDEVNAMVCMMAKHYGVPRTVARIRDVEITNGNAGCEYMGIDHVLNPEQIAAHEIVKLLKTPMATEVDYFADGRVQLMGFRVDDESPIASKRIRDLSLRACLIVALARNHHLIIPRGDDAILPGDTVFVLGKTGSVSTIGWLVGKPRERIRNVFIAGGGNIGLGLARVLEEHRGLGFEVRLIEQDPERSRYLAETLAHTVVLNGDATDLRLMREEGVAQADAFVAATGDDETNILSALLAKQLGAGKCIAEISRTDYEQLVETLGIDAAVHPRLLTASAILRLIRGGRVVALHLFREREAEVSEVVAAEDAPGVDRKLKELVLPRGVLVGVLVRGRQVVIPRGNDVVLPGDRVIIFGRRPVIARVEALFCGEQGES